MERHEAPDDLKTVFEMLDKLLLVYENHNIAEIELAVSFSLLKVFWDSFEPKEAMERAQIFIAQFLFFANQHAQLQTSENHTLQ